ncbi:MAG: DUF2167 domain-containing protein [Myxococcota bacterium]
MFAAVKKELDAIDGPKQGVAVGDQATIDVPAGYWFVPASKMARLAELTENLSEPGEAGALIKGELDSVVYFTFDPIGYVKDEDSDLDAAELLKSMQEGQLQDNIQRKQHGFDELEVVGWAKEPFYNQTTKSLEWATILRVKGSQENGSVNYNTRRLGRGGVMSVILVSNPDAMQQELAAMNANLGAFAFVAGKDYASFQQGDHVAEIGLGALVVGGGAALAVKVGFFKKFWKILAAGGAAVAGGIAKLFRRKKPADATASGDRTVDGG